MVEFLHVMVELWQAVELYVLVGLSERGLDPGFRGSTCSVAPEDSDDVAGSLLVVGSLCLHVCMTGSMNVTSLSRPSAPYRIHVCCACF